MIPKTTKDVLNDYTPVLLGRVSSSKQRKGLPAQMEFLKRKAKELGFKKKPVELAVRQSGKDGELKTLEAVLKLVEENPKQKFVAVFRDSTRIARDTENALALRRKMSAVGVPILALDLPDLTGKKPYGNRSVDVLFNILSTISESGKDAEQEAQQEGVGRAALAGLVKGVPQSMYLEKVREVDGKPMSLHRRFYMAIPALDSEAISMRDLAKKNGFISKGEKTFGQPNTTQPRKLVGLLRELEAKGGKKKVAEYLEVIDAILAAEKKVGRRDSAKPNRKAKALHRVTVGYLQNPMELPRPDTIGNPAIAELTGNVGDGTIADAIKNPTPYQPAK
jgi:DNA invertase Pin-like site-specific DNA recombinase